MRPERLDKVLPLTLITLVLIIIGLRVAGVFPPILATDEFEISRTIFIDAGIGGLLAVLAIVISLTLMGIQFASQEYTHRVMNTYLKSYMLWSMIISYIATVLYNLYMTASMQPTPDTIYAEISVLLQSLCLIMLIPHFIMAVIHLKPDYTIGRILRSVNQDYILSLERHIGDGKGRVPTTIDRLLPAVEIIERSISRGDRETVRWALEGIQGCYEQYVNPENEHWAARYFLDYLLRIGREAVIEADDDSIVQVLNMLGDIGSSTSTVSSCQIVIEEITTIGLGAVKKDYDAAGEQTIDSLQQIMLAGVTEKALDTMFKSVDELTELLFSLDKRRLIKYLTDRLSGVTDVMIANQDHAMINKWCAALEKIGRNAVINKLRDIVNDTIQAFYHVGTLATRNQLDIVSQVIEPLLRIEREVDPGDRELVSEIEYVKKEIEEETQKNTVEDEKETGIDTSDLW